MPARPAAATIEDADKHSTTPTSVLLAVTPDGVPLEQVTAIHNFGAGDLVEITPAAVKR